MRIVKIAAACGRCSVDHVTPMAQGNDWAKMTAYFGAAQRWAAPSIATAFPGPISRVRLDGVTIRRPLALGGW